MASDSVVSEALSSIIVQLRNLHAKLDTHARETEARFESVQTTIRNAISHITCRINGFETTNHRTKRRRVNPDPSNHLNVEQREVKASYRRDNKSECMCMMRKLVSNR